MRTQTNLALGALVLSSALFLASSAHAVDGVIEINQEKVLAAGGFPYAIAASGSYRLTSNLDVTGQPNPENLTVISIQTNNVSIDLNGFAIIGPANCSGTPLVCSPCGAGFGIAASTRSHITVLNGTVRGMGFRGVQVQHYARVENVHATHNCAYGIYTGDNSQLDSCTAEHNGSDGIHTSTSCVLTRNISYWNGGHGFYSSHHSVFEGNVSRTNGGSGFYINNGSTVRNNTATSNGTHGFYAGLSSLLIGNSVLANSAYGLYAADFTTGYGHNNFSNNNGGNTNPQVFRGTEIDNNMCGSNPICP
jgi:hypothetical protein